MSRVKRELSQPKLRLDEADEEAARWKLQIELAERANGAWEERCEKIIKRYRDEEGRSALGIESGVRGYNILWSNVQTLKPTLYGREPVPIAERRFLDKDVVGRVASQILERAMRYEMLDCGFDDTAKRCVYDYLLVGRGVAWLRFTPAFGPASSIADRGDDQLQDHDGGPADEPDEQRDAAIDEHHESGDRTDDTGEKLVGAKIDVDYVNWKDFLHSKARIWPEVEWVARRHFMSRQDLRDSFNRKIADEVPLDRAADGDRNNSQYHSNVSREGLKKATVYEIWCKYDRKVYFIAKGYHKLLEKPREDPLNLEGFWPCPEPLYATLTNGTLEPVPDYAEYQDQAKELDKLTQRIDALLTALKVVGLYDASQKDLARLLSEGGENKMIPVTSWAAFSEKGGIEGAVAFMPLKEIAEVLDKLFVARKQILEDLYQITGLSDIIRGQADPRETAEAIKTKGRFGSLRLQDRQAQVARFCRDIIRLMGEIICEHYPDQVMIDISGIMYEEGIGPEMPTPPQPPQLPQGGPQMPPQTQGQLPSPPRQLPPPQGMMGQGPPGIIGQTPPAGPQNGVQGPPQGQMPSPGMQRPQPGGPPVRAPDGHFYVHAPHSGGPYQRVVQH